MCITCPARFYRQVLLCILSIPAIYSVGDCHQHQAKMVTDTLSAAKGAAKHMNMGTVYFMMMTFK